ncbi:MAG TPA: GlsB/YeaQ/YmgE family stress response membrane protein, partial [Xanthobacteraceae bacterium]|nr:GlsB/YeaQ/YmgE family stress response membrane protein [Xanthobacteraceae bacterium]
TVVLGIAGSFFATFIGQAVGWYRPDQGAGFIAATVGAVLVLFIWHRLVTRGVISDPGAGPRA